MKDLTKSTYSELLAEVRRIGCLAERERSKELNALAPDSFTALERAAGIRMTQRGRLTQLSHYLRRHAINVCPDDVQPEPQIA